MTRLVRLLAACLVLTCVTACSSGVSSTSGPTPGPTPSRFPTGPAARATSPAGQTSPARLRPPPNRSPRLLVTRASWSLPTALSRAVVISSGGSGVMAGGLMPGDITTDRAYRVSTAGVGARLPSLAEPVHDAAGAQVNGRAVIVGGGNSRELSAVESARPGHGWKVTGHLPGTRSDLSALATPRGLLVIGGYDGLGSPRTVLVSTNGRTFVPFTRLRHGVRYAAVVSLGRSVWVFGGEDAGRELDTTQVIDLVTKKVRTSRSLPTPLGHAAVTRVGSRILLMGGRTSPHRVTRTMLWCDPATGRFSRAGRLPYPVADTGVLHAPGAVFLLGGEAPDFTDRVMKISWG